jgi:hypothetical protein
MSNRTAYLLAFLSILFAGAVINTFGGTEPVDKPTRSEVSVQNTPQPTRTPQPTPTINPFKARQDKIKEQFSFWDGSHNNLVAFVKERMHNPKSFEHVETTFADGGIDYGVIVTMRYRGTNTFGAIVTNSITARVDINGNIIEITE